MQMLAKLGAKQNLYFLPPPVQKTFLRHCAEVILSHSKKKYYVYSFIFMFEFTANNLNKFNCELVYMH